MTSRYLHSTNGIEVASQLRATNPQIVLIFVSEYVEYAPFGYEVDAIRYLLKNHLEQAFDRVMSEAVKKVREKHLRYAIVTDAGNVMVKFEDILYVEGQKRKVTYHLQNNNRASYDCSALRAFCECTGRSWSTCGISAFSTEPI